MKTRCARPRQAGQAATSPALAIGLLATSIAAGFVSVPLIYLVFFILGTGETLADTASSAFVPTIVDERHLPVANSLLGGTFTTPVAMFPLKAMTIEGTMTGTLAEAREMMALARSGKIPPIPITERPFSAAQATLDDLRGGRIVGRVVLTQ